MAGTIAHGRVSSNGTRSDPVGVVPVRRRQRSVPLAAVAAIFMVASILAFVGVQLASTERVPVLAVARPVDAGAVITDDDLRVAQVAVDPALSPVALSDKGRIVGRTAAVDLVPGSLVVESSVGEATAVGEGEALVGVEVPAAAAPIGALRPGDHVQVIAVVPPTEGDTEADPRVIAQGRVLRVASAGSGAATTAQLSLVVPTDAAPAVASASTGQRLAVVVVP